MVTIIITTIMNSHELFERVEGARSVLRTGGNEGDGHRGFNNDNNNNNNNDNDNDNNNDTNPVSLCVHVFVYVDVSLFLLCA